MRIRLATTADSDALLAIYTPYIETPITFEEVVPSAEVFRARMAAILEKYPYLVAENDAGAPVGYAYAHELRERIAYQWNAELSVYLAPKAKGYGLGKALYQCLIELLAAQGIKAVWGVVTYPNAASDALHASLGFELMGRQKNAGYKSGAWHDMSWYVKYLAPFENEPGPPMAFPELCAQEPKLVEDVLAGATAALDGTVTHDSAAALGSATAPETAD